MSPLSPVIRADLIFGAWLLWAWGLARQTAGFLVFANGLEWPIALVLFVAGTEIRVRSEDALLRERFGERFVPWQQSVPAYLPFVRRQNRTEGRRTAETCAGQATRSPAPLASYDRSEPRIS